VKKIIGTGCGRKFDFLGVLENILLKFGLDLIKIDKLIVVRRMNWKSS